jgi:hypothetical protein
MAQTLGFDLLEGVVFAMMVACCDVRQTRFEVRAAGTIPWQLSAGRSET